MRRNQHHIIFWIIVFLLLNVLFGSKWNSFTDAFFFTSMLFPVALGTAYFFNGVLVPRFLNQKNYFTFSLYSLYTLIASVCLSQIAIVLAFILLTNLNWQMLDPLVKDVTQLQFVIYVIVFLFGFIQVYQANQSNKNQIENLAEKAKANLQESITVRSNRQNVNIRLSEINYIESLSDYVKIWNGDEPVITREKISHLEEKLPDSFVRCHRSYLANANKIDSVSYDQLVINGKEIPIGRKYKTQVSEVMKT